MTVSQTYILEDKVKIDIWHNFKFLCQEMSRVRADQFGEMITSINEKNNKKALEDARKEILEMLSLPSNINRIKASAEKQMCFYCKHLSICY